MGVEAAAKSDCEREWQKRCGLDVGWRCIVLLLFSDCFHQVARGVRGEVLVILMGAVPATKDVRAYFGVAGRALPTAVFSDMRVATDEAPQGFQQAMAKGAAVTAGSLKAFLAGAMKDTAAMGARKGTAGKSKKSEL